MSPRTLVVFAGVALLCAGYARSQQSAPSQKTSTVATSASQPSTSAPSVTVGPDQVRPATAPNQAPNEPNTSPRAATPNEPSTPVPNPNPPAATKIPQKSGSASAAPSATPEDHPYIVGPLDVLEIRVWNDPKLSGMYPVRPDGMISMPLIGEIKADGLSVPGLSDTVRQKLNSVMNDPEVNIQVAKINSKRIFVFGGVLKPGEIPLYENMTVLDALSNVGFKDFANPKKITVMRGTHIFHFNYKEVSKGKHMEQNIYLQNGDRIFVPE